MNVQERSNWTNKNIDHLKNVVITEYDLASGGLSVIKENKLLSPKYIAELDGMEKEKKNIVIGKLQAKIPDLAKNMVIGFGKARQAFVDLNAIPDENILSIKKDAIFLVNCYNVVGQVSENLLFRAKNTYSSYIRLNNKEIYFSAITKDIDVKGLSDEAYSLQKDFILKDISRFLSMSEKISEEQLYLNLKKYRSDYLNRNLPIETYRQLDTGIFVVGNFEMKTVDDSYIDQIDISFNYQHYILPLIKILLKGE